MSLFRFDNRTTSTHNDFHLFRMLVRIKARFHLAVAYTLPKSTMRDHISDCFGFLWQDQKPYHNKALSRYTRMMVDAFKRGSSMPIATFLFEHTGHIPANNNEEVEIDIVRGDRRVNHRH